MDEGKAGYQPSEDELKLAEEHMAHDHDAEKISAMSEAREEALVHSRKQNEENKAGYQPSEDEYNLAMEHMTREEKWLSERREMIHDFEECSAKLKDEIIKNTHIFNTGRYTTLSEGQKIDLEQEIRSIVFHLSKVEGWEDIHKKCDAQFEERINFNGQFACPVPLRLRILSCFKVRDFDLISVGLPNQRAYAVYNDYLNFQRVLQHREKQRSEYEQRKKAEDQKYNHSSSGNAQSQSDGGNDDEFRTRGSEADAHPSWQG